MPNLSLEGTAFLYSLPTAAAGALLGYFIGNRHEGEDRKRRARQIATGLLIELRCVEPTIREMYLEEEPVAFDWYLPLPLFDQLLADFRVFKPDTLRLALSFHGLILEIKSRLELAARNERSDADDNHFVRAKAAFALERMRPLVVALKGEGGVLPPLEPLLSVRNGELPPLPAVQFPEALREVDVGGPARHD